jgi:hypothetical protein
MDWKSALVTSCRALLVASSLYNYEALKEYEETDMDNEMANIMPKVYFATRY